jgi:FkbM family methyltransferase
VLQGFRNVRLVQKGVSEKSGKMDLYRSEKYPATNSLHYRGNGVGAWNTESKVEVAITTVDEYCTENHIDHIDLLKIDTEGNDYFVLKGAERILRTGRVDTIVFEFSLLYTYSHIYFIDFAEYLGKLGYEISKIMPLGTAPVTEPVYERTQDAYFVAKRKAGKIFA